MDTEVRERIVWTARPLATLFLPSRWHSYRCYSFPATWIVGNLKLCLLVLKHPYCCSTFLHMPSLATYYCSLALLSVTVSDLHEAGTSRWYTASASRQLALLCRRRTERNGKAGEQTKRTMMQSMLTAIIKMPLLQTKRIHAQFLSARQEKAQAG